jgi:mRNA-degrading endonuclease RelE of RelBE toxin-antitoxin system
MATVTLTPGAQEQFDALPTTIKARMQRLFRRLENWPHASGAKPLRGALAGQFRLRTGDYRVQFRAQGETVVVTRVGHRDGFYDE